MIAISQWGFLKHSAKGSFDIMLCSVLVNILGLALPLSLMQVYDRIIPNEGTGSLTWLVIGCTIAIWIEAFLRLCRDQVSSWLGTRYSHFLNMAAIDKILHSDPSYIESQSVSSHVDRLAAINTVQSFYSRQFFESFVEIPFSLIYLATIAFLNQGLAQWIGLIIGGLFLVTAVIRPFYKKAKDRRSVASNNKFKFVIDALSKIHYVKAFAREDQMVNDFRSHQARQSRSDFAVSFFGSVPSNIGTLVSQLTLFMILGLGAGEVISGNMTMGVLTACMLLGTRLVQPAQNLANLWLRSSDLAIARKQLQEVFHFPDSYQSQGTKIHAEITGSLTLDKVSYRTTAETPFIFEDLSLHVEAKEMVGISASTSRGSAELLNLMAGLEHPQVGQVLIDRLDLRHWHRQSLRGRVAYLSHQPMMFRGTVLENLTLFDPRKTDIALDTAAMANLDASISQLPKGYNTMMDRESRVAIPISVMQLIAFTRALIDRPKILIMDRVDAPFDERSFEGFFELIQRLKGHTTLIMATDNENILKTSDRIIRVTPTGIEGISRFVLLSTSRETAAKVWKKKEAK